MSCHSCATNFGFLKKEHGCPSCNFAFCGKCLKYESQKFRSAVCRSCSEKMTTSGEHSSQKKSPMDSRPPPDAFLRRLETLEDPTRPPVTVYTQNPNATLQSFQAEQNPVVPSEQEIRGRLQKLRKRLVAAPSVEEMEERLARLQGMPLKTKAHSIDVAAMPLSGEEQTRKLLEQMHGEAGLDHTSSQEWQKEIEARLARLKGMDEIKENPESEVMEAEPTDAESMLKQISSQIGTVPDEADEESELKIVNKILAEVALAEKLGVDNNEECSEDESISETMEDELPWCCICNEDATLRCPGCAGELYCSRCFKEGHDVCDMSDHKPTSYQPKHPV
ncbi:hypothetical protein B566_EDAN007164 [Ephemera danica]|nr:hypothetical protein B566_EDAN007164 [Ephemera danica]